MTLDPSQRRLLDALRRLEELYSRQRNLGAFTEQMQQMLTHLEMLEGER